MNTWSVRQVIVGWCICAVVMVVALLMVLFTVAQVWEIGFRWQATATLNAVGQVISATGGEKTSTYDYEMPGVYEERVGGDPRLSTAQGDM